MKDREAVVDAGPFIHLNEIGQLHLLNIFDSLHIPDTVWNEVTVPGRVHAADVHDLGNIDRHLVDANQLSSFVSSHQLHHLQVGELEALCLAQRLKLSLILTDDLAVRDSAKLLGITPVGSLGIIVRAFQLDIISLVQAEIKIRELHEKSTLFVTAAIIELVLERLHQERAS